MITCLKCRSENPDTARFCERCGTQFGSPGKPPRDSVTRTLEAPPEKLGRGTLIAGRYEVIEALGAGGMGEVYRVEDKKVGQDIALKFIRPEIAATDNVIERFRRELKTARMIAHRNVCRMFDLGEDQGTYFITMEYVSGEDLKSFIRRSTQLAAGTAIRIARQVAEGLAEAHRLGVIHRDLKPQNIMIDKEGNAKIMDFGIARTAETVAVTREGAIIGTPEYMPPEQAEGRAVDQRSDLYSLGAVLFEMLTGKLPFEGRTAIDLAIKHKTAAPPDPKIINPHIAAEVSRLVLKCLEKEAPARYQTALELISDLDRIESANPARPRSAIPAMSRKAKVVFGILAVAILIAVLLPVIKPRGRAGEMPVSRMATDLLTVIPFDNLADPDDREREARMISNLVLTALSASGGLRVASEQRLFDGMKELERDGERTIDRTVAAQLARRVGGTKMVVGDFSRLGARAILTSQILHVQTGEIVRSQRVEGDDLFAMADELSGLILRDLGFSAAAKGGGSKLADLTTSSEEAYGLYLQGLDRYYRYDYAAAEESFRKAVAIDPGFALAYWRLAWMQFRFGMGDMAAAAATAEIAYGLRGRLPEKERLYVEWLSGLFKVSIEEALALLEKLVGKYPEEKEAWSMLAGGTGGPLKNPHKAIAYHQKWLALDPGFKAGYLWLVRDYLTLDELDKAAESASRYLEIAPDDAVAHQMMGYVHYFKGALNPAMEEFEKALTLDPQYDDAVIGQAQVLAKGGRFAESKEKLAPLFSLKAKPEHRVGAYFQMGWNSLAQKKFGEAEGYLKEMNGIILAHHLDFQSPFGQYALGWAYLTAGRMSDARREFEVVLERNLPTAGTYGPAASHYFLGIVALRMGQPERARAEARDLKRLAEAQDNLTYREWHDDLMAIMQASRKSVAETGERPPKRPGFFLRDWWGWMTDIPGGIPLP